VAQALRVLDPSDVLLEAVAKPVRAYLQARKDTVRCIVTSLTDENSGGSVL
jgi:anaphase-promoting complex subunit 2